MTTRFAERLAGAKSEPKKHVEFSHLLTKERAAIEHSWPFFMLGLIFLAGVLFIARAIEGVL